MIIGSTWGMEEWEQFFQKQEKIRTDGKKCNCKGTYIFIQPEERLNNLYNWQCNICQKQFKGT